MDKRRPSRDRISQADANARPERVLIAVAVVEHEGSYLIGQRPRGAPLAGFWEFPGGKVQPGETAAQAAQRECAEETSLDVVVCGEFPTVVYAYPHGQHELRFFACRLAHTPQAPRAPYRWVPVRELAAYEFPPANAGLIALLTAQLGEARPPP